MVSVIMTLCVISVGLDKEHFGLHSLRSGGASAAAKTINISETISKSL